MELLEWVDQRIDELTKEWESIKDNRTLWGAYGCEITGRLEAFKEVKKKIEDAQKIS